MWKSGATPNTLANPSESESKPVAPPPVIPEFTPPAPRSSMLASTEQATIGKALVIKGEVSGSESLYIDGRVEGAINLTGNRVTVGRNGVVTANISAREIVVLGKVKGNLNASDKVELRNEGSLIGDVFAQRISIEDGAFFKGGIDLQKAGQKNSADGRAGKLEPPSLSEGAGVGSSSISRA